MYTPRKNSNYNSPYTKPIQQYPSQNEDYISFSSGGPMQSSGKVMSGQQHSNPRGFNWQKRGSTPTGNYNAKKQWASTQKGGGSGGPQRKKNYHNEKNELVHISSYVHPSMTEDPWKDLMNRIEALNKSKISIKSVENVESEPVESNDEDESTRANLVRA